MSDLNLSAFVPWAPHPDAAQREHQRHREGAVALAYDVGGVAPVGLSCVERAVDALPRLWGEA